MAKPKISDFDASLAFGPLGYPYRDAVIDVSRVAEIVIEWCRENAVVPSDQIILGMTELILDEGRKKVSGDAPL